MAIEIKELRSVELGDVVSVERDNGLGGRLGHITKLSTDYITVVPFASKKVYHFDREGNHSECKITKVERMILE